MPKSEWTVPIFRALRDAEPVDGSRLKGAMTGVYQNVGVTPKYHALNEIAYRFVRRHKVLALNAKYLELAITNRWGRNPRFGLPLSCVRIGYLIPNEIAKLVTTSGVEGLQMLDAEHMTAIVRAAQYRDIKLIALRKQKYTPEGQSFEAWIIATETIGILKEKGYAKRYKRQ